MHAAAPATAARKIPALAYVVGLMRVSGIAYQFRRDELRDWLATQPAGALEATTQDQIDHSGAPQTAPEAPI